jgi:thioredoxin-dependent peroxiredoxin
VARTMLKVGQKAPVFTLPSTSGAEVSLASLAGRKVVLYFYPRDDTPGCTREACEFRDYDARFKKSGAVVLGVSSDTRASHDKFRAKYSLPFDLLVDADNAVAKKYGAYGEKVLYGKKTIGTIRSTFVIDEQGKLAAVWARVKVDGHAEKVLAAVTGEAPPKKAAAAKPAAKKTAAKNATALKKK